MVSTLGLTPPKKVFATVAAEPTRLPTVWAAPPKRPPKILSTKLPPFEPAT